MPGYIIHLTEAKMIIESLRKQGYHLNREWINTFYLGCLLPDTRRKGEKITSHFWHPDSLVYQAIAPDMDLFMEKYGLRMRGPLLLGYRTHLMLDILYVNEFWDKILEFQNDRGERVSRKDEIKRVLLHKTGDTIPLADFFTKEYYYGDYSRLNAPLRKKYAIDIPYYKEEELMELVDEVSTKDLLQVLEELKLILEMEDIRQEEELRVLNQELVEAFIREASEEACDFIREHIYLIATDLDGTLLRSGKILSRRNRDALEQCISLGDQVIVASGRPFSSLPSCVMEIPDIAYAITSNGAAVFDCVKGKRIIHNCISEECAEKLFSVLSDGVGSGAANIEIMVDGIPYTFPDFLEHPENYGFHETGIHYIKNTRKPVEDIYAFAQAHISSLEAVDIIPRSQTERRLWLEELEKLEGLFVTSSTGHIIEISDQRAGKGQALKALTEKMSHPRVKIYAFGNEANDLDMMEYAGVGVAVANSTEPVLRAADRITASNDEDGVAVVLEGLV